MVWPADIIAHGLWRVSPKENGPRMAHGLKHRFGVFHRKLQMLRRQCIDQRDGIDHIANQNDRAIGIPTGARCRFGGQRL